MKRGLAGEGNARSRGWHVICKRSLARERLFIWCVETPCKIKHIAPTPEMPLSALPINGTPAENNIMGQVPSER